MIPTLLHCTVVSGGGGHKFSKKMCKKGTVHSTVWPLGCLLQHVAATWGGINSSVEVGPSGGGYYLGGSYLGEVLFGEASLRYLPQGALLLQILGWQRFSMGISKSTWQKRRSGRSLIGCIQSPALQILSSKPWRISFGEHLAALNYWPGWMPGFGFWRKELKISGKWPWTTWFLGGFLAGLGGWGDPPPGLQKKPDCPPPLV